MIKIREYHVLPDKLCDSLIQLFETDSKHHERFDDNGLPNFTQLNLNKYHYKIISTLCEYFNDGLEFYKKEVPTSKFLPPIKSLEEFRIKKYEVGGKDRFDEHVDVTDYASSKRSLSMLFYLNDVDEGGNTVFPYHDIIFKPQKGKVIIFPPTWEYPHYGEPPISNTKYIMSSYLHYM